MKEYKEATRILNQAEMQVGAKVVSKRGIFQNFLCSAVFLPYLYYTALQNIEGFISTRAASWDRHTCGVFSALGFSSAKLQNLKSLRRQQLVVRASAPTRARHISGYPETMALDRKSVLEWAARTGWGTASSINISHQ